MTNFNSSHHLVSTTAEASECPKCHRGIWIALVNGFEVKVEPTPLNLSEEVVLRMESPKTRIFQTMGIGGKFELQSRSAWHITKGDAKAIALPEHDCKRNDPGIIIDLFKRAEIEKGEF